MIARQYIQELAANGQHHFNSRQAHTALGGNHTAVLAQLRRLKQKGLIAEPARSFYVIVPPEYQRLGCLPAEQFIDQLMQELGEPYYIALLSAAQRHGAAHQRPQATQVMVQKNRAGIVCGEVSIEFIARKDLENMPVTILNTPRGVTRYASPEVTALELVGYPAHAGGLNNIATILSELAEELKADLLIEAAQLSPISWSQRLGYILDLTGHHELAKELLLFIQNHARSFTPLRRAAKVAHAERNHDWKLIVNVEIETDL